MELIEPQGVLALVVEKNKEELKQCLQDSGGLAERLHAIIKKLNDDGNDPIRQEASAALQSIEMAENNLTLAVQYSRKK